MEACAKISLPTIIFFVALDAFCVSWSQRVLNEPAGQWGTAQTASRIERENHPDFYVDKDLSHCVLDEFTLYGKNVSGVKFFNTTIINFYGRKKPITRARLEKLKVWWDAENGPILQGVRLFKLTSGKSRTIPVAKAKKKASQTVRVTTIRKD